MKGEISIEYQGGYTKFLNCRIDLSKKVFIPRIETEFWVKKAIKEIKKSQKSKIPIRPSLRALGKSQKFEILDMFAGSGCIGIAILKNIKNSFVDFVDIDKKAIGQIKINLKLNKISPKRYKIYQSNLFEKLKGKYNYIFANPPYVAKERLKEVQPSVLKYEPKISFLAGKKGLFYIRKFLKEAKRFLKPGGIIYLEFDPEQKNDILNILKKENYKNSRFFKDQFKKYRFAKVDLIEASKI
jgi:release factor glutamine methyltransferase